MNRKILMCLVATFFALIQACTSSNRPPDNPLANPPTISFDTDYLVAKPGYMGNLVGAEVIDSKPGPDGELQVIDINIPVDPERVDRVQVISSTGERIKQSKKAEILRDYETNNVGVTIFVSKEKNMNFKLRLIDNTEVD